MSTIIAGIKIPDSALAKATTEYIRDIESDLLYPVSYTHLTLPTNREV